jgi:hypothetical protein
MGRRKWKMNIKRMPFIHTIEEGEGVAIFLKEMYDVFGI